MITYIEGDIFCSPAQVIVNAVNTVGVMGKGLALSFKNRYPEMFVAYRQACEKRQLKTGKLMLYYAADHWILLFPTKEHWRNPSKLEYIESGLSRFVQTYAEKNITSIAFPKLGCGNGELHWDDVRPIMEKYLMTLPIDVFIYIGVDSSTVHEHKAQNQTMEWLREHAKDMSFNGLVDDIIHHSAILPYMFEHENADWSVQYDQGLVFQHDDRTIFVKEDTFFQEWDRIRNTGILSGRDAAEEVLLIYDLLYSLGYLSAIHICDSVNGDSDGYQLNEGLGRAFALRGC